jgi:hypothetical protein
MPTTVESEEEPHHTQTYKHEQILHMTYCPHPPAERGEELSAQLGDLVEALLADLTIGVQCNAIVNAMPL